MAKTQKDLSEFSKLFRMYLTVLDIEQAPFAELIGVRPTSVSHWATNRPPSADLLLALEFDMNPPLHYDIFWPLAEPILTDEVRERYQRNRARCLRLIKEGRPAGDLTRRGLKKMCLRLGIPVPPRSR